MHPMSIAASPVIPHHSLVRAFVKRMSSPRVRCTQCGVAPCVSHPVLAVSAPTLMHSVRLCRGSSSEGLPKLVDQSARLLVYLF